MTMVPGATPADWLREANGEAHAYASLAERPTVPPVQSVLRSTFGLSACLQIWPVHAHPDHGLYSLHSPCITSFIRN